MNPAPAPAPGRLRLVTGLALALVGTCGTWAAWEGFLLARFSELGSLGKSPPAELDPGLGEELRSARLALEQVREPRMVVLFALALACSLSFVAAARLVRPAGLPREGIRRILVWALVGAAALRTIDGAQYAAIVRRTAGVILRGLQLPPGMDAAAVTQLRSVVAPAAVVLHTALVVGTLLLLSQYFRSPGLKAWAAGADAGTS